MDIDAKEYSDTNKKIKSIQDKVDALQKKQTVLVLEYIKQEAKNILLKYPELVCYTQGMGSWSFYDSFNTPVSWVDGVDLEEDSGIAHILYEYDNDLHVTGVPLKIMKDLVTGEFETLTDW